MSQHDVCAAQALCPEQDAKSGGAAMPPNRHDNPALDELRRQLGDDQIVDLFVADFLAVVDERVRAVGRLLDEQRIEECVTALFTLETSGTMVGADRLAHAARRLRRALPRTGHPADEAVIARLYLALQAAGHDVADSIDHG